MLTELVYETRGGRTGRRLIRAAVIVLTGLNLTAAATAAEISSFQAGNGGWHLGTLAVGNPDADAQKEIVVSYRDLSGKWFLDAYDWNGSRLPGFPFSGGNNPINVSPTLYDLDGNGRDEIIFTCGTRVIALRGDGSTFWSSEVTRFNYVPDSGYMVVPGGFYWSTNGGFIPNLPDTAVFYSEVSSPIVADINSDGVKEVVTAWKIDPDSTSNAQDFNPFINDIWDFSEWGTVGEDWSGGVVFFNANTGAKDYVYHFHQLVESGIALGQADADAALEVYVLNDSDSVVCFDKTQPHGLHGNGTLHGQFGKNQRLLSGAYQQGTEVSTVDIDGDGRAEVLVPTTHLNPLWQPSETILDDDGAILWREWKQTVNYPLNQWQNNACMIPVNPDRDNRIDVLSFTHSYEIQFRSWNGVELASRPGWPKSFYPFLPTPPVVGDVDGDGQEEIIIGTYNPADSGADGTLYVFALDGALETSVSVPGGLKHIPTIADVNADGGLDVVYRSLSGRIYVQNFGSTGDGPVSWSTHRGNAQRDSNFATSLFPTGTPLITHKQSGYRRASFSWSAAGASEVLAWRIYRADQPEGPFQLIANRTSGTTSYTDELLNSGCHYIYEVAALYSGGEVRSAPFAVLSSLNNNLITNGGFEMNSESHWDKWFTGELSWTNMVATADAAFEGSKGMAVTLNSNGSGGSISQFSQYGTPDATIPVTPGRLYSFGGFFKSTGLSQPSEHWLEWYSTKTGKNPNVRPARPYPFYFTPHFVIGAGATDWTYVNRTFVLPDGFPNIELTHRYSVAAPASGTIYMDNIFFRELPSPDSTEWTELIPFGATWRYSLLTPSQNWCDEGFNDSFWLLGRAKLGAGGGPSGLVTQLTPQLPAYFFRTTFIVPNGRMEELLLSATCTEGDGGSLEIHLNGQRLNTSGIEAVSHQGNDIRYYDLAPFIGLMKPGVNTIAVRLSNVWQPLWDDVAFDLRLQTVMRPTSQPFINTVFATPGASQVFLNFTVPEAGSCRLESTDSLASPDWRLVERVTNESGGTLWIQDTGQNGRLPPGQAPARFYRLIPD